MNLSYTKLKLDNKQCLVIMLFSSLNNNLHLVSEEVLAQSSLYTPLKDMAYTVFPYLKSMFFWN